MDIAPILEQGGLAAVAALALFMYLQERKERVVAQREARDIINQRVADFKLHSEELRNVLQTTSQTITRLSDKIETGKNNRNF